MATSEFPAHSCDIVMKGGITSGVVYPLALVELARKYRFCSIGGTSAGAIAAAAAAAAEYGRGIDGAGFDRLGKVPAEIGPKLLSLFQPTPALSPLYNMLIAALQGEPLKIVLAAVSGYWQSVLLGGLAGLFIATLACFLGGGAGFVLFGALLALVGMIAGLGWRLLKAANTDLAASDFGLCPGISQSGSPDPGLTDWLAQLIESAAGPRAEKRPLTFGDLEKVQIGGVPMQLKMMTTSLTEMRPYTLPLFDDDKPDRHFMFRRDEWAKLFPASIMSYLVAVCDAFAPQAGEQGEFFRFPDPARLPLVVGARMSLSFPGLISAVPLWCYDDTLKDPREKPLKRCLFSDGGLSSDFPIHFFDRLLPNRPTFAISLDDFDPDRNDDSIDGEHRPLVWLPKKNKDSGSALPVEPFQGLGEFLLRIVYSAKNWQDNLQSVLPGYRERIVHVVPKPDEGGINLTMPDATVKKLSDYGTTAGQRLCTQFDMDEHRWRRFLVAMARMEETLGDVAKACDQVPDGFSDFLARYVRDRQPYRAPPSAGANPDTDYLQDTRTRVDAMLARAAELVALGRRWSADPIMRGMGADIPKPATNLRITPKY